MSEDAEKGIIITCFQALNNIAAVRALLQLRSCSVSEGDQELKIGLLCLAVKDSLACNARNMAIDALEVVGQFFLF